MNDQTNIIEVKHRIQQLGFHCPNDPPTHKMDAPIYSLLCMPMYYVASAIMFKTDEELSESLTEDLFGIKNIREAFVIGEELADLPVSKQDATILRSFLVHRRPVDSIIYDFALDTIKQYFDVANPDVVELAKTIVARTVVAVAHASGDGWFGGGSKATPEQKEVIQKICTGLELSISPTASRILDALHADATG